MTMTIGCRKFIAASASRVAIRAVEPAISANKTVACLRSPAASATRASGCRGLPHDVQNRAVSGRSCPQCAHTEARETPQAAQNLLPASFS